MTAPYVVILMGVSGVGKTTVGRALARTLGWAFVDADDLHSAANKAKMERGEGLTDADRTPWLAALRALIARHLTEERSLVLACSALRTSYRDVLRVDNRVRFVWLDAPSDTLRKRLDARRGHFANAALLKSQMSTLEPPPLDEACRVNAVGDVGAIAESVAAMLARGAC